MDIREMSDLNLSLGAISLLQSAEGDGPPEFSWRNSSFYCGAVAAVPEVKSQCLKSCRDAWTEIAISEAGMAMLEAGMSYASLGQGAGGRGRGGRSLG